MDVLQLVKNQHGRIRALCESLQNAEAVTEKRKIFGQLSALTTVHLRLEADYLFPEVTAVEPSSAKFVEDSLLRHKHLVNDLKSLEKKVNKRPQGSKEALAKSINMLSTDLKTHLVVVEDEMLPRIRQSISTQEREDLGEVLMDVLTEELEDTEFAEHIDARRVASM